MSRNASAKVDPKLKKAIDALLKKVTLDKLGDDGKPLYSLTVVMKVIDRKLKLAAIEAKVDDAGYGAGFGTGEPEKDNDDDAD